MMKLAASILSVALIAAPAFAQTAPAPADTTAAMTPAPEAPAPATPAETVTPAAAPLTIDSPIELLLTNERIRAGLAANMGGDITQAPFYPQIKSMSFKQLQPLSQGALTDEAIAQIAALIAASQ